MSIKVTAKTKAPETQKLMSHIMSYLFEQECGEFRRCSRKYADAFLKQLGKIVNSHN